MPPAEPLSGAPQVLSEVGRNDVTVAGEVGRRLQDSAQSDAAEPFEQPPPRFDCAGHGHAQHAARRHLVETARPNCLDRRKLARASSADEAHGGRSACRPNDRHQVAADGGHVRVDDTEHRIRGDRRIDRVSAVAQDLSPHLARRVVRGRDDPFSQRGVMNSIAPG